MTTMCTTILVLILITTFMQSAIGLSLEINQPHYTEASRGPLQMTCLPDASDIRDQKHVMVLELGKEDQKPLAFVSRRSGVSYGTIMPPSYQASGLIGENGGLTRLTVKIPNPTNEDSGHYFCRMYYFDALGAFSDETAFANVTINIVNTQTTALEMQESMARLEAKVTSQTSEVFDIHTLVTSLVKRVTELTEETQSSKTRTAQRVMELEREVLDLKGDLKNETQKATRLANMTAMQSALIADLGVKVSFTAGVTSRTTVPRGKDVVFDKIIMRQGGGYDPKTGIFTVPVTGTYSFGLDMLAYPSSSDRLGIVGLLVDGKDVASLLVDVPTSVNYLQSSTSTVARLTVGQQVKAQGYDEMRWNSYPYSVFTGFLVSPE